MPQPEPDARKGYCMWEEREGRAVYAPLEWRAEAVREELGYVRALPDEERKGEP